MQVQNDRHEQVECTVCFRKMRSDNLKRHMRKHRDLYSLDENDMREEIKERKRQYDNREERTRLAREIAQQEDAPLECIDAQRVKGTKSLEVVEEKIDKEAVRKEMVEENQQYIDKIELGRMIASIIDEENIYEQSLSKEKQEALLLFRSQQPQFNIIDVELRPWQQDAMKYFESPTERQVIWIRGNNGNEGKSWFQNYVQTFFGYHRVCRLDLRIKHANVCNV